MPAPSPEPAPHGEARRRSDAHLFVGDLDAPVVDERDLHHLLRVLRLRRGQSVSVADGSGRWRICTLQHTSGSPRPQADLEAASEVFAGRPCLPELTVAFALPKGERPEWALAKLTELGVDRIVPLVAARSVVRWEDRRAERHRLRWAEVTRHAAMQSRRLRLPVIEDPTEVATVLGRDRGRAALALPGGDPPGLSRPTVLIGPEGGWAPDEEADAPATVGLGPQILRTETAAVVAASLLVALRGGVVDERHRGGENHPT